MLESNFNIFFSIFYIKNDASKVLARFDLDKAWREFVFAFGIPGSLFIISFISLCIITRSVKVGDDAKMRCKYCIDENSDIDDDIDELANKCVQQLNAIEEAVNEQDLANEQPSTSTSKVSYLLLFFHMSLIQSWANDDFQYFLIFISNQQFQSEPKASTNEPKATTSRAVFDEPNADLISPINLSPCTADSNSISTNIELKQTDDKPLVEF